MRKIFIILISMLLLFSVSVSAAFYSYDQQIDVTDSDGSLMGYVLPYEKTGLFNEQYAYLKWQRQGYLEGNTFPVFLVKGTTIPLIFGVEGEFLKVKVNSISGSGVDLTIDKSDVISEVEDVVNEIEDAEEQVSGEIKTVVEQTEKSVDVLEEQLTETANILDQRVEKVINRGYYSSLHIVNNLDSESKVISRRIAQKEAEFAEKISDRIVPIVLDAFAAGTGLTYTAVVKMIPSPLRNEMTQYLYNIDTETDASNDDTSLSKRGAVTIYVGNPQKNRVSAQLNSQLKSSNLPYFEGDKIKGKRTYSEGSVGLIAAIPEEKVWTESTLENRWANDRIRNYKTLIAGIDEDGLEAAADWYNDQLDNAATLITSVASFTDGADSSDVLKIVSDNFNENPKSTVSSAALMQGWILTGFSSLQSADFNKVDSLGYVAIVKKKGSSYDILEIHTLNGNKRQVFLNPYEFVEKVEEVNEVVEQVSEITETVSNIQEGDFEDDYITGAVIGVEDEKEEERIPIISWFIDLFKRWFG